MKFGHSPTLRSIVWTCLSRWLPNIKFKHERLQLTCPLLFVHPLKESKASHYIFSSRNMCSGDGRLMIIYIDITETSRRACQIRYQLVSINYNTCTRWKERL